MKIKITADSTCDLTNELIAQYGVTITPLYVNMDNKPLRDRIDVQPQDIFDHFNRTGSLCFIFPRPDAAAAHKPWKIDPVCG